MNQSRVPAWQPRDIEGVLDVVCLRGDQADAHASPDLLIEVPHGADRRSHYDQARSLLVGELPAGLEAFFHVNTDVGAWDYGLATARRLLAMAPRRSVLLLRCLVPRVFVDCNREVRHAGGDLSEGALTAGIPGYLRDPSDRARLESLHACYVDAVSAAYEAVCGAGGLALTPHSYAPRSVGITNVGDDIVEQLEWAYQAERYTSWPLRPEIDLLTREPGGRCLAPPGIEQRLIDAFTVQGWDVHANATYNLAPGSMAALWSTRFAGQVLCLEVRRDRLMSEWRPFEPMSVDEASIESIAGALADALVQALDETRSRSAR